MNKTAKDTRKIYKKNKTLRKKNIKMNCNPNVKNKRISQIRVIQRCFIRIKEHYNKNNHDKIQYFESRKNMDSFRKKLDRHLKEDCWLNEIKDKKLRQQLDDILFSPTNLVHGIKIRFHGYQIMILLLC